MFNIQYGIGDYPEDATHENGNYMCVCVECGDNFIGHKRRVICKHCLTLAKTTEQPTSEEEPTMCEHKAVDFDISSGTWVCRKCEIAVGMAGMMMSIAHREEEE